MKYVQSVSHEKDFTRPLPKSGYKTFIKLYNDDNAKIAPILSAMVEGDEARLHRGTSKAAKSQETLNQSQGNLWRWASPSSSS